MFFEGWPSGAPRARVGHPKGKIRELKVPGYPVVIARLGVLARLSASLLLT
jgi:hypothetical protein